MQSLLWPSNFLMNLSLTLGTIKVPSGIPDESAAGIYEMLDVEEEIIELPRKLEESIVKPPIKSVAAKPALVPPPLMMGKIPTAAEATILRPVSQISIQSNTIVAQPVMRDLQKDLVSMVPSSVRRKAQASEHPPKKQKVSEEDEYEKFMSQFE
jgi:hypothetical protein